MSVSRNKELSTAVSIMLCKVNDENMTLERAVYSLMR